MSETNYDKAKEFISVVPSSGDGYLMRAAALASLAVVDELRAQREPAQVVAVEKEPNELVYALQNRKKDKFEQWSTIMLFVNHETAKAKMKDLQQLESSKEQGYEFTVKPMALSHD